MAFGINTFEVEDYAKWRAVFDRGDHIREAFGIREARVFQDANDANKLTVLVEGNQSDLEAFYGSQELKEAMAEAGALTPLQPLFVNEVT
ncbi:MAG: hypothetical protein ACE5MI_11755 [Acidimicrobiia bacterium]